MFMARRSNSAQNDWRRSTSDKSELTRSSWHFGLSLSRISSLSGYRFGGILDQKPSAQSLQRLKEIDDGLSVVTLQPSNLLAGARFRRTPAASCSRCSCCYGMAAEASLELTLSRPSASTARVT
jgi:hypothetical protein